MIYLYLFITFFQIGLFGFGGGGGGGGTPICVHEGLEIPCKTDDGYWIGPPHSCYVKLAVPQPPKGQDPWPVPTPKRGAIYDCSKRYLSGNNDFDYQFHSPTPPEAGGVDVAGLITQAITQIGIRGIEMGSTPPMIAGRVGIIGVPSWFWAKNPSAQTWGPASASVSAGGVTVTARATGKKIQWEISNGEVVECANPGTPWIPGSGAVESPTCGYTFTEDGNYGIQAVTFWDLQWAGAGMSGTIPLAVFSRGDLAMAEAQVIRVG